MSRRPTPTAVKILRGNPGKRPLSQTEPKPKTGEPEMPSFVRRDAVARKEWRRICPMLMKLGVLTKADGPALSGYCVAFAMLAEAQKEIREHGLMVRTQVLDKHGSAMQVARKNPCIGIAENALKIMKAFLVEFGLTPASRTKVNATPLDDESQILSGVDDMLDELSNYAN